MLAGFDLMYMVLEMKVLNSFSYKREMFRPKYHRVEIKYLGAIQKQCQQLFCQCDAFSQYSSAFALAIATCQHELERLYQVNRTQDSGLKTSQQVQNYLALS